MSKYRKKIIAGNWKMNKSVREAQDLTDGIIRELAGYRETDIVLCPPFTSLKVVGDLLVDTYIKLGAQNMHWEPSGAYTGEVSPNMLRDLFCHYVILGHSERRAYFNETDKIVNTKVKAAISTHLVPIMCVGETKAERESGQAKDIVRRQIEEGLRDVEGDLKTMIVAYEPVWAIGTGLTATPDIAQEMHAHIREILAKTKGEATAQSIRIQYGGSVKPENAAELFKQPDIDGGLIGGASLEARAFAKIVEAAV
ncbi:MAG: triose-phosphate isomerase [Lentisphaerae bacterium]|nr:triose-phosphate isomerase [Lentisphaerota bacterium]